MGNGVIFSRFGLSVLALSVTQQLYAQDISIPKSDLGTLSVNIDKSGLALASRIEQMPEATQIITAQQIANQTSGTRQLADVLSQLVPSLGVSSGTTSNFGQTMRGRQVQFLLNGVPLTGSRDISRQLNAINANQIQRIEVLSGATSIYGAGATGGLINIVTKSNVGDKPFQTRLGVTANNNFDSDSVGYQIGQTLGVKNQEGNLSARLDIDYAQTGGAFDSDNNRIAPEPAQTDKQDTDSISINANMDWYIDDHQNVNLAVTHYKDGQDTDFAPDYGENLAVLFGATPSLKAIKGLSLDNQPENTKQTVNLNYHNDDIGGQVLNATAYYRKEKGTFYPFVVPFSVSKALPILQGMQLTPEQLAQYSKALQGSAYGVLQSASDVDVMGGRIALQKKHDWQNKSALLTYGLDYEQEKDQQSAKGYDLKTFMQSNGLNFAENGQHYTYGPDTTIDSMGAFVNADVKLNDKWKFTSGVRYQRIDSDTDSFTPPSETLLSNLLAQYNIAFDAQSVQSGNVSHNKTLFNLGTSYEIDNHNKLFANFSQGYSLPDLQRVLRDVNAGFVVNSKNVEPISVNSYDLGWSGDFGKTKASLTGFYNTSDKVVQFLRDYSATVADTDERIYGAEAQISHHFNDAWSAGGSVAYTRGQYKDAKGDYKELGAFRVTPLKGTAFTEYSSPEGHKLRLQMLAVDGTDKAYQDNLTAATNSNVRKTSEARIKGYAIADLIAQYKLPKGQLDLGIYNLFNTDYKTVFSQAAASTYGAMSSLDVPGRNYGLRYTINY